MSNAEGRALRVEWAMLKEEITVREEGRRSP